MKILTTACALAMALVSEQVPAGAWLIQRPGGTQRYYVNAYDGQQPGVLLDRAAFDYRRGVLVLIVQLP